MPGCVFTLATRQITSAPERLLVRTTNSPGVTVAERRTTAPCGKMITVRVSSWTGGSFAAPFDAEEYREACTVTGISALAASLGCELWASFSDEATSVRGSFAVLGMSTPLQRLRWALG